MTTINGITIAKLTELCRKYDDEEGCYPEHELEGEAVLKFILDEITKEVRE